MARSNWCYRVQFLIAYALARDLAQSHFNEIAFHRADGTAPAAQSDKNLAKGVKAAYMVKVDFSWFVCVPSS
jgi:hypothetical protein